MSWCGQPKHVIVSNGNQIYKIYIFVFILNVHFNITLPSEPGSPKWSPSLRSSHQNPICTLLSALHGAYHSCMWVIYTILHFGACKKNSPCLKHKHSKLPYWQLATAWHTSLPQRRKEVWNSAVFQVLLGNYRVMLTVAFSKKSRRLLPNPCAFTVKNRFHISMDATCSLQLNQLVSKEEKKKEGN